MISTCKRLNNYLTLFIPVHRADHSQPDHREHMLMPDVNRASDENIFMIKTLTENICTLRYHNRSAAQFFDHEKRKNLTSQVSACLITQHFRTLKTRDNLQTNLLTNICHNNSYSNGFSLVTYFLIHSLFPPILLLFLRVWLISLSLFIQQKI